jgi:hypothetical protein
VTESPGALGGLVKTPAPKILPDDRGPVDLASGYSASQTMAAWVASRPGPEPAPTVEKLKVTGPAKASGKKLRLKVSCPASAGSCAGARIFIEGAPKSRRARGAGVLIASKGGVKAKPGSAKTITLNLTGPARKLMRGRKGVKKLPVKVYLNSTAGETVKKLTLKRVGKVK